ncbi:MAG TPA: aromatic-ring-hydroxylating dioxygenase subunit beta [Chloroflexota bacterium]|jgi:p-cumate 2,3-dioxygenase beta subunit
MGDPLTEQHAGLAAAPGLQEIEQFFYYEAALLDEWRLDEWLTLFTEDARYVMPSTDHPETDPRETLGLINDDMVRLRGRVERLKSRRAHREFPWSRTRRLVTNVRVKEVDGDDVLATASFLVYRIRGGHMDPLVGQYQYRLTRVAGQFKIRLRRAQLDLESLSPHGTVSIIV